MTLQHQSAKEFDRSSRIATETLTCGTALATKLLNSATLRAFLTNFAATTDDWDPLCAGHFQRILTHLVRESNGDYLKNFPDLIPNTVNHLNLLAVAELLISLAPNYSAQIVPLIVDFIGSHEGPLTASLYALRQILTEGFAQSFGDVIPKIAAVAKSAKNKVVKIELYRILEKVVKVSQSDFVVEEESGFESATVEAFAKAVNFGDLKSGLASLVGGEVHWGLGNKVLNKLRGTETAVFLGLVNELGVVKKLKEIGENATGQQLELVNLIVDRALEIAMELPTELIGKAGKLNASYGGELPIGGIITRVNAE
jgi:hypothetical protein